MGKIPKKIHYCWFGKKDKDESMERYIDSWKKYCPGFDIIEWNEYNFDVHINKYVEQAYNKRKYAFVSDFARLYILKHEGGIYLDTDVELIKSLDNFENNKAYIGFQDEKRLNTGLIASEKNNKIIDKFLEYYNEKDFIKKDGSIDITPNVETITSIMLELGLKLDDSFQEFEDIAVYPKEYFCPIDYYTGEKEITNNTVAIHWFASSWLSGVLKIKAKILRKIYKTFGKNSLDWLKKIMKKENKKQ